MEEAATVLSIIIKYILWDLMNKSDALDAADIKSVDKGNHFIVTVSDESTFQVQVSSTDR